ncbi:peptide transporter [Acinetobacter qingfengensis]|uniref:Peptide transporter n=2 Tax=Acinetobacter qingfengensis TaxID=1262585 RepID=A0A1E7R8B3_9GAMM|nr:peptide transporter [Acinetobacter qingfengensis]
MIVACLSTVFSGYHLSYAVPQTLNYISLDAKPRYHQVNAFPFAHPNAPKGGYIAFPAIGTFDNFNSMNGKGSAADGVQYLYDGLMKDSPDEPGVAYPLLAKSVTYDPQNPAFAVFHLNPEAKFSDGSPVTARDVVYTFNKILNEGAPGIQIYFSGIAKVTALNRYDVRFDFKGKDNKELPLIVASVSIFSEKDLKNKDFSRVTLQAPLGSGPYTVKQINPGRSIIYQRNPQYWAKDLPINRGAYNFDQIRYIYYRNLEIAFEGFKTGQYTLHTEYSARRWMTEYNFNAMNAGLIKKIEYHHRNPIATQSLSLNTRHTPLNDIFFRQALSYAYDFEWQNKALFYGKYKRLQSYFDNSELAATGMPSSDELKVLKPYLPQLSALEKYGVMIDWRYPVSDGSGFNRDNLLTARRILLQRGYRYNAKGQLLDKNHQPIRLELLITQDSLKRTLMPFVRNLKRLGIQLDVRQVDSSQYLERMRNYDYDIIPNLLPQSLNPGNEQARFWTTESANQPGNYNYPGIKSPVIDAVVQQLINAKNRDELITYTRVLDRLLRAGFYEILTYGKDAEWYACWDMYEQPSTTPQLVIGLDYWWVNPQKAQKITQYIQRKPS